MIIGVIGGVGSGKSTVLDYLETQYCAKIIKSDDVAKELMEPGKEIFNRIAEVFSEVIVDGMIQKEKMASLIFSNEERRKQLNEITHPATIQEIKKRIKESNADIVVVESALLIGTGIEDDCDEIWFVFCEREKRIQRLMENRGYSREKSESIIDKQPADEEYNLVADEFIDNSYSATDTQERIDLILSTLPCGF
ncbi:MAG: dephospho-CoA kinase [Eubacterium sp.]|nr:dephospho-CoA kinase [Eubacterium sp.]